VDLGISASPETVGTFAAGIPLVAVPVVEAVKGAFYSKAPIRWQAWLPDKWVWPLLAGVFCIGACLLFKLDVGARMVGADWPTLPLRLGSAASGAVLGAVSAKGFYPLMIRPAQKLKAMAALSASRGEPTAMPSPLPPVVSLAPDPPVVDAPEAVTPEPTPELPAPLPDPGPVAPAGRRYVAAPLEDLVYRRLTGDAAPKRIIVMVDLATADWKPLD
jgi:hypothetical protein